MACCISTTSGGLPDADGTSAAHGVEDEVFDLQVMKEV